MAEDKIKRFERWRQRLPEIAAYLVTLAMAEIVPLFQARGFDRCQDYAGGDTLAIGRNCLPLQRRRDPKWPTVEILFDKRYRPFLGVTFAMLPDVCWRKTESGLTEIPRLQANVTEGCAFFSLCKGYQRSGDCNFGYAWFSFNPKRKLRQEIDILKSILPWLFDIFDSGIPPAWPNRLPGYVDRHAFLNPASNIFLRAEQRGQA